MRDVKLSRFRGVVEELSYPTTRDAVLGELDDVRLLYADGTEPLGDVLRRSNETTFASAEELETEVYNNLPTEAVGEPGQSEGEG